MTSSPLSVTAAATVSIVASGWAAGMGTGLSVFGIPTILNGGASAEVMTQQWRFQFLRGQAIMPAVGLLNAINYWGVAYRCWSRGLEWRGFAAAGASTFFIIPFTLAFIMDTNYQLLAASEGQASQEEKTPESTTLSDDSARSLIKKWGDLNIVRAVVPIFGTALAVWNILL